MITVHEIEQGTKEWGALRAGKYTGSNAHKLFKYGAIKYSQAVVDDSWGGNFFTKRGHILEDEALELYGKIKKVEVLRPGFITNSKYPNCGYSPDGIDGQQVGNALNRESILLEVKCFNPTRHLKIYNGDIPLEILAQIYFGMLITDLKKARLIIYNPDLDPKLALKIIEVKRDPAVLSNLKRILVKGGE